MDDVRIWKTVRSQDEIVRHMRWGSGLEGKRDLVAWWTFNDADQDLGQFRRHLVRLGAAAMAILCCTQHHTVHLCGMHDVVCTKRTPAKSFLYVSQLI